jgi:hypothetical protein
VFTIERSPEAVAFLKQLAWVTVRALADACHPPEPRQ